MYTVHVGPVWYRCVRYIFFMILKFWLLCTNCIHAHVLWRAHLSSVDVCLLYFHMIFRWEHCLRSTSLCSTTSSKIIPWWPSKNLLLEPKTVKTQLLISNGRKVLCMFMHLLYSKQFCLSSADLKSRSLVQSSPLWTDCCKSWAARVFQLFTWSR